MSAQPLSTDVTHLEYILVIGGNSVHITTDSRKFNLLNYFPLITSIKQKIKKEKEKKSNNKI